MVSMVTLRFKETGQKCLVSTQNAHKIQSLGTTESSTNVQLCLQSLANHRTATMLFQGSRTWWLLLMVQFLEIICKLFSDFLSLNLHCCCNQPCFRGPRLMEQLHICWDLNSLQTPFLSHLHPHESSSFSMLFLSLSNITPM